MSVYPLSKAAVVEMLEQHGIMPTLQRIDIAHTLFQKAQHLCAEEILARVNRNAEKVSKATVYNTLGLLVKKGLVREVLVDPERVFYDSNIQHHYHLYNIDTGELTDIDNETIAIKGLPSLPKDLQIDGVDVIVRVKQQR